MAGIADLLFGYAPAGSEEADDLARMMQRFADQSSAGTGLGAEGSGSDLLPFAGIGVDMTRVPKNAEAPSTSGFRQIAEPSQPLEQGATPRKMAVPQTAPVVQQQRAPSAEGWPGTDRGGTPPSQANPKPVGPASAPQSPATAGAAPPAGGGAGAGRVRAPEPDFMDRLGNFANAYNKGGLIGSIAAGFGSQPDRETEGMNMTGQALLKMGVDPDIANAALRNPELMKLLLAQAFGAKAAPEIKEIEVKDKYGRTTKVPVTFNQRTRQWEPVQLGGAPAPGALAPGSEPSPSAPAPSPQGLGAPAPPAPQAGRAKAPADNYREVPINVNSLPAPAKGYAYALGPNGYPQFDPQDNPKMVLEKALDNKSNPTDDSYKLQEMVGNIDKTFRAANELIFHPGTPDIAGRPLAGEATIKGLGVDLADITPGTSQADAFNKHKALIADVALRTMDNLKSQSAQGATGFGALSQKELDILTSSAGNLRLSSSYEELVDNYKKFQGALLRSRERLLEKFQQRYGELPEGITPKQRLIDDTTNETISGRSKTYVRPRRLFGADIPFTSVEEPAPGSAAAIVDPNRGMPKTPPANARRAPDGQIYLPDPERPGKWRLWDGKEE